MIRNRDDKIKNLLISENIEVKTFHSHTLFEPFSIKNKDGKLYKVYTPFWKQCLKTTVSLPLPAPSVAFAPSQSFDTLSLEELLQMRL